MREIEMKILEVPKAVAFQAMRHIGAKKKYSVFMRVKYFDFSDHRIQKKRDLLRLRECKFDSGKHGVEVVYKVYRGIRGGCKVFDEFEWWLDGKHAFKYLSDFFEKLGLLQTLYYEKKRTLFELKYRTRGELPAVEPERGCQEFVGKTPRRGGQEFVGKTPRRGCQEVAGKKPPRSRDKRLRRVRMVSCCVEFDEHPKIPSFLEIEACSARQVHEIFMKLGLQHYEKSPETIEQLMKRKYPKISLNGLRFR